MKSNRSWNTSRLQVQGVGHGPSGCGWGGRYLQLGAGPVEVGGVERRGPAARVPDGGALQEHLLAVAERVAALGAARARGVEVVVLARLQHLAGDVALAVGAAHAEQPLVVALAVRHAAAAHVLARQHAAARAAREAPRVPLPAHTRTHAPRHTHTHRLAVRTHLKHFYQVITMRQVYHCA